MFLSTCLTLGLTSCVWVGAGVGVASAGIEAYRRGEHRVTQDASIDRIWIATLITLDEFELPVIKNKLASDRGLIISQDNNGKTIQIILEKQSPRLTLLRIRIGTFGDHALARAISERVRSHDRDTRNNNSGAL